MATHKVDFNNETNRIFMTNYRRGPEYNATIQNLSGQSITVTVTNQLLNRGESAVWDVPIQGAVVIADGEIGEIIDPYVAFLLTVGIATTGTTRITEAG